MRPKYFLAFVAIATTLLLSAVGVSAQVAQLRGIIQLTGADGKTTPVAGAQVDVYRTDIAAVYHTTTDKRGEFVFAVLPFTGIYVVAISAPGASPLAQGNVRVGQEVPFKATLEIGDGRRFTPEEAKANAGGSSASTSGGGESAEEKAKREEAIKRNEAIKKENEKNVSINDTLNRTFKAGSEAINAQNYDEAIKQFDEGLAADPDQVVLYSRKSIALRLRGRDRYNSSIKATDQAAKSSLIDQARNDFQASVSAATLGVEKSKNEAPAADAEGQRAQASRKLEILGSRAEAFRLLTKTDASQVDGANTAFQEYIAAEPDPARKTKARADAAQMLFDAASDASGFERAFQEYQKILENNPDDTDALLRSGQALFNIGAFNNNDKSKYQEAANYLQRYVDKAPDGQLKTEAKELIDALKAQANVTPEKVNTPPRRKRP